MADIFISYSQKQPEVTKVLAAELEALGYTTWWDTGLKPGDHYTKLIKQQIDLAKAVIVIWTPEFVESVWVLAEAKHAYQGGKLITVHVAGFDFATIPLPYNVLHCTPVTDSEVLHKTLRNLGAVPNGAGQAQKANQPAKVIISQPISLESSGDAEGWFQRGEECASGKNGVVQDDERAFEHYRSAAALGHGDAITKLGLMYQEGRAVARDDAEALRLYRAAAEKGSTLAFRQLGFMYEFGRGVAVNMEEARSWYKRAADAGDRYAFRMWRRLGTPWKLSTYRRRGPRAPASQAKPVGEGGEDQT